MTIPLVDLARQRAALEPGMSAAIARVIESGAYVGGPDVRALEEALSQRLGGVACVPCANGTDALELLLRGADIGAGDVVFVPSLTFAATIEAVVLAGATPVFVDVDPATGTLCPESLRQTLAAGQFSGTPRAVFAVDLFSLPADHRALLEIGAKAGMKVFSDAAHSIGTDTPDGPCGALTDGAATSFYPSKAIGCYGDGGAVFTRDADFAERMRAIANHGVYRGGSGHAVVGRNSRMDSVQAAIVMQKLSVFDTETARRRQIGARYRAELARVCTVPPVAQGVAPVWSYFAILHPARDALQTHLAARGVGSVAYYRQPNHTHPAFAGFAVAPGGMAGTQTFADGLLCLPLHPYMTDAEVDQVIAAVASFETVAP